MRAGLVWVMSDVIAPVPVGEKQEGCQDGTCCLSITSRFQENMSKASTMLASGTPRSLTVVVPQGKFPKAQVWEAWPQLTVLLRSDWMTGH
jgi:hypothetical protein